MPSPIMVATLQAAVLSTISNFCAQLIGAYQKEIAFSLDLVQLFRFIVFTLMTAPPNYLWQQFLERSLPAYPQPRQRENGGNDIELKAMEEAVQLGNEILAQPPPKPKFSPRNTLAKWFIDCMTVGAIMNTVAFLLIMGLLKGQPASQISSNLWKETIPIIVAGYKIWPIASMISFTFIPVHRRILWLSFIGLIWGIYMSLVAARV